jgi:hypothetical protein
MTSWMIGKLDNCEAANNSGTAHLANEQKRMKNIDWQLKYKKEPYYRKVLFQLKIQDFWDGR